jgi:hypothetical protein
LGIDVYVWADAGGMPGPIVAGPINVPGADLVFNPAVVEVDLSPYGLIFCDDFHVGYTVVDQAIDNIAILMDDGTCGSMRGSAHYGGMWETILDLWGIDANFVIAAEVCCAETQTSRVTNTPDMGEFRLAIGCGSRGNTVVYHTCPYSGVSTVDHYNLDNGSSGTIAGSEESSRPSISDNWVTFAATAGLDYREVYVTRCSDFGMSYQASNEGGTFDMFDPIVSGRTVAWIGQDLTWSLDTATYNLFWGDTSSIWVGFYELHPLPWSYIQHDVDDTVIVWSGTPAYDPDTLPEVFMSIPSLFIEVQLTENSSDDIGVRVSGDWVVWSQHDGNDYEIVMHSIMEPPGIDSVVTENDYDDRYPEIQGSFVVWNGFDGEDWEIFLFKGGYILQLTDNVYDDLRPQIEFPLVVWMMFDGYDWEVCSYDITLEAASQITDNDYRDSEPVTNGVDIVWTGFLGGDPCWQHDIFRTGGMAPPDLRPGDANGSEDIDIDDVVYLIAYIFSEGSPPQPYEVASGDADCSCGVDIDDVVYLIAYIFSEGPAPCSAEEWVAACGPPLK